MCVIYNLFFLVLLSCIKKMEMFTYFSSGCWEQANQQSQHHLTMIPYGLLMLVTALKKKKIKQHFTIYRVKQNIFVICMDSFFSLYCGGSGLRKSPF